MEGNRPVRSQIVNSTGYQKVNNNPVCPSHFKRQGKNKKYLEFIELLHAENSMYQAQW